MNYPKKNTNLKNKNTCHMLYSCCLALMSTSYVVAVNKDDDKKENEWDESASRFDTMDKRRKWEDGYFERAYHECRTGHVKGKIYKEHLNVAPDDTDIGPIGFSVENGVYSIDCEAIIARGYPGLNAKLRMHATGPAIENNFNTTSDNLGLGGSIYVASGKGELEGTLGPFSARASGTTYVGAGLNAGGGYTNNDEKACLSFSAGVGALFGFNGEFELCVNKKW